MPRSLAAETAVVTLEHIGKRYGTSAPVLSDVSLTLAPGGFYCVTGASGSGKTTLLNIVGLAEPPSQGKLALFGADPATLDRAGRARLRRRMGIVFQNLRLVDGLSAHDNVAVPLHVAGITDAQIRANVPELLAWVGLETRDDRPVSVLSAGERRLVAVARALIGRPELLIADEPAGDLDVETSQDLVRVLEQINGLGTTVLIATRDAGFAERFAGQFEHQRLLLEAGRLVAHKAGLDDDR